MLLNSPSNTSKVAAETKENSIELSTLHSEIGNDGSDTVLRTQPSAQADKEKTNSENSEVNTVTVSSEVDTKEIITEEEGTVPLDVQERIDSVKSIESDSKFEGPDTSSFAAFILSLFSLGTGNYPETDLSASETSEDEHFDDERQEMSRNESDKSSSSYYGWSRLGLGFAGKTSSSISDESTSKTISRTNSESSSTGSYSYLKWIGLTRNESKPSEPKIVEKSEDRNDLDKSDISHFQGADHSPLTRDSDKSGENSFPSTPRSPVKLPDMSDESFLLKEQYRFMIYSYLPAIAQGREWVLLYRSNLSLFPVNYSHFFLRNMVF